MLKMVNANNKKRSAKTKAKNPQCYIKNHTPRVLMQKSESKY